MQKFAFLAPYRLTVFLFDFKFHKVYLKIPSPCLINRISIKAKILASMKYDSSFWYVITCEYVVLLTHFNSLLVKMVSVNIY